jgi:DNA-directed RNA polymerase specialized sigma24 family protein
MSSGASISRWIDQLKNGSPQEAQERIYEEYFRRLADLASARLGSFPAPADGEDVALSALCTFFRRMSENPWPWVHDRTDLWRLLVAITKRRVARIKRRRQPGSLDDMAGYEPTDPSPEELAREANDLLERLKDESLRRVVRLRLQGYSNREIAHDIGRSVKTVEWKLRLIRRRLRDLQEAL